MFGILLLAFCPDLCADQSHTKKCDPKPTLPVPAISQQDNTADLHGKQKQDINANVKITNLPERDFYDKAPVWINFSLAVITLGTGIVVGWQAIETRRAAQATVIAAESAKQSGEAYVEVERAWLTVETGTIPDEFEPDPMRAEFITILPVVTNCGKTPAGVVEGFIKQIRLKNGQKLPSDPDYSDEKCKVKLDFLLPPGKGTQPMLVKVAAIDFISFRHCEETLYIYGFIKYSILKQQEDRETRFCFKYIVPRGFDSQPRGFSQALDAPSSYTRWT